MDAAAQGHDEGRRRGVEDVASRGLLAAGLPHGRFGIQCVRVVFEDLVRADVEFLRAFGRSRTATASSELISDSLIEIEAKAPSASCPGGRSASFHGAGHGAH